MGAFGAFHAVPCFSQITIYPEYFTNTFRRAPFFATVVSYFTVA